MTTGPERTHFFDGRLLTQADFEREQRYLIDRLRRHNRFAHGWGVLHGLGVRVDGQTLHVGAGVAIDCEGNEVELPEAQTADLAAFTAPLYVGVAFVERPATPVPGPDGVRFATTVETAELWLDAVNACAGHARRGPGTPGCGQRHAVVLARVAPEGGGWRVRWVRSRWR